MQFSTPRSNPSHRPCLCDAEECVVGQGVWRSTTRWDHAYHIASGTAHKVVARCAGDVAFYRTAEGGEHLKGSIQDVLDWYRDNDIATAVRRGQNAQKGKHRPKPASEDSHGTGEKRSLGSPVSWWQLYLSQLPSGSCLNFNLSQSCHMKCLLVYSGSLLAGDYFRRSDFTLASS